MSANHTKYTQTELAELHSENFRRIANKYLRGHVVGATWFLRVTSNGTQLVTPYKRKDAITGKFEAEWQEYCELL